MVMIPFSSRRDLRRGVVAGRCDAPRGTHALEVDTGPGCRRRALAGDARTDVTNCPERALRIEE
jgi:hypothetical protein